MMRPSVTPAQSQLRPSARKPEAPSLVIKSGRKVRFISSTVAIFTARETDAFIDSRIRFLGLTDEERAVAKKEAKAVAVSVIDNGPGIPKEIKSRVFDMFYTGENKVADSRRSLGLGLALCKSIINAHGGEITLNDNQPQGCNFTFTLPLEEVKIDE